MTEAGLKFHLEKTAAAPDPFDVPLPAAAESFFERMQSERAGVVSPGFSPVPNDQLPQATFARQPDFTDVQTGELPGPVPAGSTLNKRAKTGERVERIYIGHIVQCRWYDRAGQLWKAQIFDSVADCEKILGPDPDVVSK